MKQGLSLRTSQHLALTPQLQQSIRLLQLSTMELSSEVDQMLDDNPFLERSEDAAERESYGLEQADTAVSANDRELESARIPARTIPTPLNRAPKAAPKKALPRWTTARAGKVMALSA